MKKLISLIAISILFSSCLKKIEETENLNTNIFDKDYAGSIWFRIDDMYSYINSDGMTLIHIKALVPRAYLPDLKPTYLPLDCSVNGNDYGVLNAPQNTNGDFVLNIDATPVPDNTYCLTMGIYDSNEDITINTFTDCSDL